MWVILQNSKTEYNDFYFVSIMATPLFLIVQSKLKYTFFPRYQQVIGKNRKYIQNGLSTILTFAGFPD